MINIVHKMYHIPTRDDIYIGRPTPLGNRWSHLSKSRAEIQVETRKDAVRCYKAWLPKAYVGHLDVRTYINKIVEKARAGDVNLVCWCAPMACHGDVIKAFVEKISNDE